ncbi:NAD-dependent formate dehydrogenase subunit alpha [Catellatospora sp. IY07-71]|uniref:formate dehydrogenase subunit alpha n=1 Tax=Catellatospora sp. IY07-71 TaxID=2728827 RepID=UPI001BB404F9|nr:formate dehydrogenase subunit alpha [Catellatospora sp. IY07-71]BCJ75833.1 NAD-dependent formate dehydrogenase subunit alpha [Catellatospora sp. IY07-71]
MRVTVDGRQIELPSGATVLEAARAAGAAVPTLCHDDRFSPSGSCRLCLVRVDGRGVVAACAAPAADGDVIRTGEPDVVAMARQVLELTVERLPGAARRLPTELAARCRELGVDAGAFAAAGRGLGRDDSHPYVHLDRDLCIACGRCVRMCDDVQGTFALTLAGRGADTVVAPGPGRWAQSACVSCGGCVDTCPTGAITQAGRPVAPASAIAVDTTCGYCGVGCALTVHVAEGRVDQITPDRRGPVNRGHACVKGRFAYGFATSPERLTTPLIRDGDRLEPASWEDALALIGERIGDVIGRHGPDAVAAISSARATNEENYLMQKLMRTVVGTNNVDNCSRICHAPSAAGLTAAFGLAGGTNPAEDIERASCILVAGANPTEAHPVIGARIRQRALSGAKLVVIDPRRTELAALADVHLAARPGSNVAVFNGLARIMLEQGWTDPDFLADRADGLDILREQLRRFSPERVAELSGVAPPALREAARLYGTAHHPMIIYGLGVTEHTHGTDGVRTLANLAILRGAVGTPHGGGVNPLRGQNNVQGASDMGALPDLLPGYQPVADARARARCAQVWGCPVPDRPGLRIPQMFDAALDGRLRALYVFGENIVQTDPDSGHVRAALAACEFVVCQEIFLTGTARLADVVLPGASFLEKDGTFVNFDRRFQRIRPALPTPGSARTDFAIIQAVAAALGGDLGCATPAAALDECARVAPLFAGVSHARLDRDGPLHWPCRSTDDPGQPRLHLRSFATPNGRAQLAARDWLPPGEQPDEAYPYVLITGRRLTHYNAGTMTRRTPNLALQPHETLDIHPADAAALGLRDGEAVEITSRRGSVTAMARLTPETAPGQVFLAFHFPEVAANLLTSAAVDEVTSCPEYKVTAVRLRPR